MFPPKEFALPFIKKQQEAKDVYSFYFDQTHTDFSFIPGNWIRVTLNLPSPDQRGNSRSFSIASSPLQKDILMITTKISQSVFKQTLYSLTPRDAVQFFGPVGRFLLNEEETQPHILLAGGIGITPFHSMLSYAHKKKLTIPLTLFASFATVEDMMYYHELQALENEYIKIIYTITQPAKSLGQWHGETGRISEEMIKKYVTDPLASLYYIVGPGVMVSTMEEMVKEMHIPQEQIRKETFVGY